MIGEIAGWCCGWDNYLKISTGLPVNPVGDTPGFSKPAKDINDLVSKYKKVSVFLNTSTISPIPMALLEAAACGCPIVTNATCEIPEIFTNGENCWMSTDFP
jgi:glycosyltransferase involved in cell wall biosynthesis